MRSLSWILVKAFGVWALTGSLALASGNWHEHVATMNSQRVKIAALEADIHNLINSKKQAKNPEDVKVILDEMVKKHQELTELAAAYDKEVLHTRFKHPSQDNKEERKYSRYQMKSLREMESDFGLDGKLNRIKKRLQATFRTEFKSDEQHEPVKREPSSDKRDAETSERIILRK